MTKRITVKIPATCANCGAGFDSIGLACTLYNTFQVGFNDTNTITLKAFGEGSSLLKPSKNNFAIKAVKRVLLEAGINEKGIDIKMENAIPLSRGLGSSSAAIVGGMLAANALLDYPFTKDEIFALATEQEGHPDNIAPAIYGGVTVSIMEKNKPHTIKVASPENISLIAVVPNFTLSTKKAREVLPDTVPYSHAVFNLSRASLFIGAMCNNDLDMLEYALNDKLHQPYRGALIPGFQDVFKAAKKSGAIGAIISGAGPTLMAFSDKNTDNKKIAESMCNAFKNIGKDASYHILSLDNEGAQII